MNARGVFEEVLQGFNGAVHLMSEWRRPKESIHIPFGSSVHDKDRSALAVKGVFYSS